MVKDVYEQTISEITIQDINGTHYYRRYNDGDSWEKQYGMSWECVHDKEAERLEDLYQEYQEYIKDNK